jgi:hypothetical protein
VRLLDALLLCCTTSFVSAGAVPRTAKELDAALRAKNPWYIGGTRIGVENGRVVAARLGLGPCPDLSALRGLKLREFDCAQKQVEDLSPLAGMPLKSLACAMNPIADLSPLRGAPLVSLDLGWCKIADLSPLKGMPLTFLCIRGNQVSDLSPLRGMMTLRTLLCDQNAITDLSPLAGVPLRTLHLSRTHITDLSPLKGAPIRSLDIGGLAVADLTPLLDVPLHSITLSTDRLTRGAAALARHKTLVEAREYEPRQPSLRGRALRIAGPKVIKERLPASSPTSARRLFAKLAMRAGEPRLAGVLPHHTGAVRCVAVSPDGTRIASASDDGTIRLWDGLTGTPGPVLKTDGKPTRAIVFLPSGERLISGSDDGRLRLWDDATGECLRTAQVQKGPILSLAVPADGACVVSAAKGEQARVTDAGRLRYLVTFEGDAGRAISAASAPNGNRVACLGKTVSVWEPHTGKCLATFSDGPFGAIAFARGNPPLPAARQDIIRILPGTERSASLFASRRGKLFAFSPDDAYLAVAAGRGGLELRPLTGKKPTAQLVGHEAPVTSLVFGPKGQRLVTGSEDSTVRVWTVGPPDPIEFWKLDQFWRDKIEKAMQKRIGFDFVETPFQDIVSFLSGVIDITIVIDAPVLKDRDPTVTSRVKDVSVRDALKHILPPMGLTHVIFDGVLVIATPKRAKTVFAPEAEAVPSRMPWEVKDISFDFVETPIQDVLSFVAGAGGHMIILDPKHEHPAVTLRVDNMPEDRALRWICRLTGSRYRWVGDVVLMAEPQRLEHLDRHRRSVKPLARVPNKGFAAKLAEPISFDFVETPMQDVADFLAELTDLPIVLDPTVKEENNEPTVTLRVKEMPLRDVLVWTCTITELSCAWRDGKLVLYHSTPKGHL